MKVHFCSYEDSVYAPRKWGQAGMIYVATAPLALCARFGFLATVNFFSLLHLLHCHTKKDA